MALFPAGMPLPQPNMDDAPFWQNCSQRRLCFQCCADCGLPRHPPTPLCPRCHSAAQRWLEAPDAASIYTFTVVHHAAHPAVVPCLPYVIAAVEFAGFPQVRLVTNVTDIQPSQVRVGMKVQLWWDRVETGPEDGPMHLPRFRPAP